MIDCLIIIDRDGTLIEKHDYLGRFNDWKEKVSLFDKTVFLLKALEVLFPKNLKIVFTNQTGIALGYLNEDRVIEINKYVDFLLQSEGIRIEKWIYSPEADESYAAKKDIAPNKYVKTVSNRKPNPVLLLDEFKKMNISLSDFERIIVIGDSEDDRILAENLKANFIFCR